MIRKWMSAIASMILLAGIAIPVDAADISSASAGLESGGSFITVTDGVAQIDANTTPDAPLVADRDYYPLEVQTTEENGRTLVVKRFEVPSGTSPQKLVEQNLQRDGTLYTVRDILKKELENTESKAATKTVTAEVETDDEKEILSKLSPTLDYKEDGYTGQLQLDTQSVEAQATDAKKYAYTVKDTKQYPGLNRNDPYDVPKTVEKDGVTLQLTGVSWTPTGEEYDENSVPSSYTATATYTGKGYGSKAASFEVKSTYTGEVSRKIPGNILYTLVYEPARSVPITDAVDPSPELKISGGINWMPFVYMGCGLVAVVAIGSLVFLMIKSGVFRRRRKKPYPARSPKQPRAKKVQKPSKPQKKPREEKVPEADEDEESDGYDEYGEYGEEYEDMEDNGSNETAYADREMPGHRKMRVPEAMRQMERPEMGGDVN